MRHRRRHKTQTRVRVHAPQQGSEPKRRAKDRGHAHAREINSKKSQDAARGEAVPLEMQSGVQERINQSGGDSSVYTEIKRSDGGKKPPARFFESGHHVLVEKDGTV